jgi:hypothetical protein
MVGIVVGVIVRVIVGISGVIVIFIHRSHSWGAAAVWRGGISGGKGPIVIGIIRKTVVVIVPTRPGWGVSTIIIIIIIIIVEVIGFTVNIIVIGHEFAVVIIIDIVIIQIV